MCAPVGLQVETRDLHRPHLHDAFGKQIDLRANQIWDLERLFARQNFDSYFASLPDLEIDCRFDPAHQFPAHGLEFKIHAPFQRLHVSARHFGAIITEDNPAQDVESSVSAHQFEAPLPVQGPEGGGLGRRQRLGPAEKMMDIFTLLLDLIHRVDDAARFKRPKVAGLSASTGIECRAVQHNRSVFRIHRDNGSGKLFEIGISLVK